MANGNKIQAHGTFIVIEWLVLREKTFHYFKVNTKNT